MMATGYLTFEGINIAPFKNTGCEMVPSTQFYQNFFFVHVKLPERCHVKISFALRLFLFLSLRQTQGKRAGGKTRFEFLSIEKEGGFN